MPFSRTACPASVSSASDMFGRVRVVGTPWAEGGRYGLNAYGHTTT